MSHRHLTGKWDTHGTSLRQQKLQDIATNSFHNFRSSIIYCCEPISNRMPRPFYNRNLKVPSEFCRQYRFVHVHIFVIIILPFQFKRTTNSSMTEVWLGLLMKIGNSRKYLMLIDFRLEILIDPHKGEIKL